MADVVMPQMGESIAEGTIVRWIKKVGDAVERDEPLFEISTDKVDAEIPSPAAGILTEITASEGETVAVDAVVGTIGQQFIVTAALPRLVMFVGATAAHLAIFMGLYVALGLRTFPSPGESILRQALGNAIVGMIAFAIVEALPGVVERRRIGRRVRR